MGLDPRSVVPRPDGVVGADVDPLFLIIVVVAVRVCVADGPEGVLHRAGRDGFEQAGGSRGVGLADGLAVPARAFAVDFVEEGLVELGGALEGGGEGGVGDFVVVGDEDGGLG